MEGSGGLDTLALWSIVLVDTSSTSSVSKNRRKKGRREDRRQAAVIEMLALRSIELSAMYSL